ncbi:MAG: radical SAM protein, partial [Candidatus Omnitrophica bacterium]|nr:radical SAM protein [Candidatus Omnitrophota bacterium]
MVKQITDRNTLLIFPKTGIDLSQVNIQMPMGLMSVAAPLVNNGYDVVILDQRVEKDFFHKCKHFLDRNPVCVGISVMTGLQIKYALKIAQFIRDNSRVPIVFGGIHPSLMPDQTIRNRNVDIIVRGEGERSFSKLVDALYAGRSFREINGISWREGGVIYHNPEEEFCDLDKLPPVPYSLVDIEKYIMPQVPGRKRSLDIYTSRGCPYSCIFCYNRSFNKSVYRTKDIDRVIQEVEELVRSYNLDSFYINDDNFFVDIERTHYFCRTLINKKIIPEWGCQGVRIDSLEKIDFALLEDSGCRNIFTGIESGSDKILKFIRKGINLERVKGIINKFANSRIIPHYNFMVGYPIEEKEDLFDTIELVNYIFRVDPKAQVSSFHMITPY